ncbi:MAG: uroporphyrinogen-III synthase [Acidimicrobiales bacterium]
MPYRPLAGFSVGVTADRRRHEQAELFERQGARVVLGPTMASIPLERDEELRAATRAVIDHPPDFVIVTTAEGLRQWLATACLWGIDAELRTALAAARIAGRGAKVQGALSQAGFSPWWMAPDATTAELVERIGREPLAGARVAVQHAAGETEALDPLRAAGATVVEVPLYRWGPPVDLQPAERLVDAAVTRRLDAVTFTSAPAAVNLFNQAAAMDRRPELLAAFADGLVAGSIGPVCTAALRRAGVSRVVQPERPSLAGLARAVSDELGLRRRCLDLGGVEVVVQGSIVRIGPEVVLLSDRERAVLDVLCARAGTVVPKSMLLREVWSSRDPASHTLDVTVGRLRRRLGPAGAAIRTVARRGYWLDAGPPAA